MLDLQLKNDLSKAYDDEDLDKINDVLQVIETSYMKPTIDMLKSSQIVNVLKAIQKAYISSDTGKKAKIGQLAKNIISTWKSTLKEEEDEPARKSSRDKKEVKSYNEEVVHETAELKDVKKKTATGSVGGIKVKPECMPIPIKNADGNLVFKDHPEFRPNLTPKEVLQAGSFGGTYYRSIKSGVTGETYGKDQWKEFPRDWFEGLNIGRQITSQSEDLSVNKYKATCGGDLNMWESSGWITPIDPYGWFQWYCRFYLGRRCSDDTRQISRGNGVMSDKGRWRTNLMNKVLASPKKSEDAIKDYKISPKIRQLLQHWGYTLTLKDLLAFAKKKK